jgi:hypothetical protein
MSLHLSANVGGVNVDLRLVDISEDLDCAPVFSRTARPRARWQAGVGATFLESFEHPAICSDQT